MILKNHNQPSRPKGASKKDVRGRGVRGALQDDGVIIQPVLF